MMNLLPKYGHYLFLLLVSLGLIYASGGSIKFDQLPTIYPKVLSMFISVPEGFFPVLEVLDGDTIVVDLDGTEETVRLLGVDTPETRDPRRPVQCFGKQASDYTKQMLLGKAVKLVIDPSDDNRDSFGRLLRYIYIEDGTMINERLVYDGYAFAYEKYPTARTTMLKQMEADAKKNNRGLWGGCEVTIKDNGKSKATQSIAKP